MLGHVASMWIPVCAFGLIIRKFLNPGINIASPNMVLVCLLGNMIVRHFDDTM